MITYINVDRFDDDDGEELDSRFHYYAKRSVANNYAREIGTELLAKPKREIVSVSDAGPRIVGRVHAGGEKDDNGNYALISSMTHHQTTNVTKPDTPNSDSLFFYSDGFFFTDPMLYNEHLATTSLSLAYAAMYLQDPEDSLENYKYKHAAGRQFLADIGCADETIYVNDSFVKKPSTDSIGFAIANKTLQKYDGNTYTDTDFILVPITIRSGGYEAEWASNMTLGDGNDRNGEAQGFSEAADQVMSSVEYYISKYGLESKIAAGKVKFWVAGFSRGGATANITSKRLIEKYCYDSSGNASGNEVFAYCNEPPKGGSDKAEMLSDKTCYYRIHNILNASDVVPLVAPIEMGFKRYGVDHYVPGTAAGEVISQNELNGLTNRSSGLADAVTTYRDNDWLYEKSQKTSDLSDPNSSYSKYVAQREKMIVQLRAVNSSVLFDDFFWPKGFKANPFIKITLGGNIGSYLASNRQDFLYDFFSFLQKSAVPSRNDFALKGPTISGQTFPSIQQSLRDIMTLIFMTSNENLATASDKVANITDKFHFLTFSSEVSIRELFDDVVGEWNTLKDSEKSKYITFLWDCIEDTGALDVFTEEELSRLQSDFPTVINLVFNFVDGDWAAEIDDDYTYPSGRAWVNDPISAYLMYALTFALSATSILQNHSPEVVLAWVRSYDSYYDNENTEYFVNWGSSNVSAPTARITTYQDWQTLQPDNTQVNNVIGDQKLYLDVENVHGEAIYYTLEDIMNNTVEEKDQIYRGGIDLKLDNANSRRFKITSYASSYGSRSANSVYFVNMLENRHFVNVVSDTPKLSGTSSISAISPNSQTVKKTYSFREGDAAGIIALHSEDSYFVNWTVTDDSGNDVTAYVLGDTMNMPYVTFTMPMVGSSIDNYTWQEGYTLNFIENANPKETLLTISSLNVPVEGGTLDDKAIIRFGNGVQENTYPVTWTYQTEDMQTVITSGEAFQNTTYTASINIPRELDKMQVFSSEEKLSAVLKNEPETAVAVKKNDTDGSVTLTITFAKTGESSGQAQPETTCKLYVEAYDLSASIPMKDIDPSWEDITYLVSEGSSFILTAPYVEDEGFIGWMMDDYNVYLEEGYSPTDKTVSMAIMNETESQEMHVFAAYTPVLNNVNVTLPEPVVGEELPVDASMIVSITNDYDVHPDNLKVTWSSSDAVANAMTQYTATIQVVPNEEGNILVRHAGSNDDYRNSNLSYILFPETMQVQVNGEDVPYDTNLFILTKTFDPIPHVLKGTKMPERIPDLPNEKNSEESVRESLPSKTTISISDGSDVSADIHWQDLTRIVGSDPTDAAVWEATGTITLPESVVNTDNLSLVVSLKVNVNEMDTVDTPRSILESGTYLGNQSTTLFTDTEGAEIYYTTDGSDPSTNGILYQGEEIEILRENIGHDQFTIRAIAKKDGMRTSIESVYIYDFTYTLSIPDSIDSLFNTLPQIGVESNSFFSLVPASEGVTIDENGNAVAIKAGTYTVTAKANEEFAWKTEDGVSSEDQAITFTIAPIDITDIAEIQVNDLYDSLESLENDLKVMIEDFELPSEFYNVSFSQGTGDQVTITVTGTDSCPGTLTKTVSVTSAEDIATLTFDPDGGTFRNSKEPVTITCKIGDTITIPEAPERKGYTFQYWTPTKSLVIIPLQPYGRRQKMHQIPGIPHISFCIRFYSLLQLFSPHISSLTKRR